MGGGQYQLSVYKEKQKVGEKLQERAKMFTNQTICRNSYHFSSVIYRQTQNCLSNSILQLNGIQCELFSLSLLIFLFLFVDLIDSLTESFPMCLTGPMGINQNPRDSHNFISNYCHQHKLNCHQHKVNCHQHKLNCHQHKLNFHQHRSICHQKKLIVI